MRCVRPIAGLLLLAVAGCAAVLTNSTLEVTADQDPLPTESYCDGSELVMNVSGCRGAARAVST